MHTSLKIPLLFTGLILLALPAQRGLGSDANPNLTFPRGGTPDPSIVSCRFPVEKIEIDGLKDIMACISAGYPQESFAEFGNPNVTASVVDDADVQREFKKLSKIHKIPFDYPEDGCYVRAEEMSRILEKEGIITAKVF